MRSIAGYHDETKRATGRAEFLQNLEAFLDARIEGDGDGWAPVSSEDHVKLNDLIFEMIALKWGVDADSDLPINFETVNRNKGRMVSVRVPYHPYRKVENPDRTQVDVEYVDAATRAAGHLSSSAAELMRQVQNHMDDVAEHQREAQERKKLLEDTLVVINGRTDESQFAVDRDNVVKLTKDEFQYDEQAKQALQAAMLAKYPNAFEAGVREIAALMAPFEDDYGDEYYQAVTRPRLIYLRVFGDAFSKHPDIGPKAQDQYQKGKAKRAALRAARTSTKTV